VSTETPSETAESAVKDAAPKKVPFLWVAGLLALGMAPFSPAMAYAGALWSLAVWVGAWLLEKKGYKARRTKRVALVSLVVTAVWGLTWEFFITPPAQVDGQEAQEHKALDDAFDKAFEDAKREPGK